MPASEFKSLIDSHHGPLDHVCKREGRVHGAEVGGELSFSQHNVLVSSDQSCERIDAVNPPEGFDSFFALAQLVFFDQHFFHMLQ